MVRTACTEHQCLYNGALYLTLYIVYVSPNTYKRERMNLVFTSQPFCFLFQIHPVSVSKFTSSPHHRHESSYKFDIAEPSYPHHTSYPKRRFPSKFETHDSSYISGYADEEDEGYYYADNKLPLALADVVPLSYAYEFAKRPGTATKEEGLNFGPRTIPKDGAVIKARKDIPEDRLHGFDTQVVESRYPSGKYGLANHEAASLEEEYEGRSKYGGSASYLSYADLGYLPESTKKQHQVLAGPIDSYNDQFVSYGDKEEYLRPHPKPCHGRGHVRVRNHEIEDDSEEEVSQYNWEDREDGRHSRIKPEKVRKGHTPINKFRSNKGYTKYI